MNYIERIVIGVRHYQWRRWKIRDVCLFILLLALLAFPICIHQGYIKSPLYINLTESAPIGLYRITYDQTPTENSYVLVATNHRLDVFHPAHKPPRFLLKHIAGVPGDTMTVTDRAVTIHDVTYPTLTATSDGTPLPHLQEGTVTLQDNEYFVANHPERSYDSRYFGPVTADEIHAVVTPLYLFSEGLIHLVT